MQALSHRDFLEKPHADFLRGDHLLERVECIQRVGKDIDEFGAVEFYFLGDRLGGNFLAPKSLPDLLGLVRGRDGEGLLAALVNHLEIGFCRDDEFLKFLELL